MTPPSLQAPKRRSDRIKQNGYTSWNFNTDDFRRPTTTQAQVDKVSSDEDQEKKRGPQKTSDYHETSARQRDKQRLKPSKRLSWPSAGFLDPHQIVFTKPTKASQKADKIPPAKQSLAPRKLERPCQSDSDSTSVDSSVDLPAFETTSSNSTLSKAPNAAKRASKPQAALVDSKNEHPHKKLRLSAAGQINSTEIGPIVLINKSNESQASEGISLSEALTAAANDLGSPILGALSLPQGPDNQPGSSLETPPRRSKTYSPLNVDQLLMREEELSSKEETSHVTTPSKSDQDKVVDKPVHEVGTGRSIHTWILRSSQPLKAWVLWPGADLIRANLQSVFAAVMKHTDLTEFQSVEIMLETSEKSFTFPTSAGDVDHFENMKQFMAHIIETSYREKHDSKILLNIWISPEVKIYEKSST